MNDKIISFDRREADHYQLLKLHNEGYRVICPLCKSDIVFSKNAGSWCSKNPNHYETHIYTREAKEVMEKGRIKWGVRETTKNLKKKGYTEKQIQEELDKYYPRR